MNEHVPDPHHTATGEWQCYTCKRPLKGSYLRPVVPWQHRPEALAVQQDATATPTLSTTE